MNLTGQVTESRGNTAAALDATLSWMRALSLPLNKYRPVIVDLSCGSGLLLRGAANRTQHLLGSDGEPDPNTNTQSNEIISKKLTDFYPFLRAVNWRADMFALNPPPNQRWSREQLKALAQSDCMAVRAAFSACDDIGGKDTIDSTLATLCIALDRCSTYGEGLLIACDAILQRLVFAANAPHASLARHIWAHSIIEGGVFGIPNPEHARTSVIYFARSHDTGSKHVSTITDLTSAQSESGLLFERRLGLREGAETQSYLQTETTVTLWQAAKERITGNSFRLLGNWAKVCYALTLGPGEVHYFKVENFLEANVEDVIAQLRPLSNDPEIEVPRMRITPRDFDLGGAFIDPIPSNLTELDLLQIDALAQGETWDARLRIQHKVSRFCLTKSMPSSVYCSFHQSLLLNEPACDECLKAWIREAFGNGDIFRSYCNSSDHLVIGEFVFAKTPFVREKLVAFEREAVEKQTQRELELLRRSKFNCYIYLMEDLRNKTFKIGRSRTPGKRERTLQSEVPQIVMRFSIPAEEAHEKQLHDRFQSKRKRGEWFVLTNDDLTRIVEYLKASGDSSRAFVDHQWLGAIYFASSPILPRE